jgi:hypothetical protein
VGERESLLGTGVGERESLLGTRGGGEREKFY